MLCNVLNKVSSKVSLEFIRVRKISYCNFYEANNKEKGLDNARNNEGRLNLTLDRKFINNLPFFHSFFFVCVQQYFMIISADPRLTFCLQQEENLTENQLTKWKWKKYWEINHLWCGLLSMMKNYNQQKVLNEKTWNNLSKQRAWRMRRVECQQ